MSNRVYVRTTPKRPYPWVSVQIDNRTDSVSFSVEKDEALTLAEKLIRAVEHMDYVKPTDSVITSREKEIT